MLALHDIEIMRGAHCVLRQVSLEVSRPGALFLVGGGGSGKSSLLGAIAARGTATLLGAATWRGLPLAVAAPSVAWLGQRDLLEGGVPPGSHALHAWLREIRCEQEATAETQVSAWPRALRRYLAVMAALAAPADLYLLDEPTAGLDAAMALAVRERIKAVAARACVLIATHNRLDCLHVGGATALLSGGVVQEWTPTRVFFSEPRTPAGRIYVDTGNCNLPAPVRALRPDVGVWWLLPGLLCGMSRPGITSELQAQFRYLAGEGVRLLICAEERCMYPLDTLREHAIEPHHFAIPDLAPPGLDQAIRICRLVERAMRAGEGVAVHCRGGLGRTGTVLAAVLVWLGDGAEEAIVRVRAARPMAIQTKAQADFVRAFAHTARRLQATTRTHHS